MATTIIEPGTIQPPSIEPPFVRLPDAGSVFAERAQRFRTLAQDHTMADFLQFMALLADAQQHALDLQAAPELPTAEQIQLCKAHGMPPLGTQTQVRDPAWRDSLTRILDHVAPQANAPTSAAIARLRALPPAALETFADNLLSGAYDGIDLAAAPFVGAALQVYWVGLAAALRADQLGRPDVHTVCPVCASLPTASLVRIGGAEQGLRYLHCSLCASEWNMVRIKCTHCESTKGIAYFSVEGGNAGVKPGDEAIKAEACDECNSYLKIFYLEKDYRIEPIADDLASLALDMLMDEAGYQRSGPNLLLFPGGQLA